MKAPRTVRPYPRLRPKTGIRRQRGSSLKWEVIRQRRPRRHARPWKYRTYLDPRQALEDRASKKVRGSLQERIFYQALEDRGFQAGVDFTFQSNQLGGRAELGGLVADFLFPIPKVIVQVQSDWHTMTLASERRDDDQAAILQSMGYTVLEIWPYTIETENALDAWLQSNVMMLWGTTTQDLGLGARSRDISFLQVLENMILERISATLEATINLARAQQNAI